MARVRVGLVSREGLSLTLVSGPTIEPITVAEAAEHGRIGTGVDSSYISGLIFMAREYAEDLQKRALINQVLEYKLDCFPPGTGSIVLPRPPLVSVATVAYLDSNGASQVLTTTVYLVDTASDPGEIQLAFNQDWPVVRDQPRAVTITYTAGYGTTRNSVPWKTRHAMKTLVMGAYDHRDAYSDQSRGNIRELAAPLGVDRLLEFHRLRLV